jgi:L-aminopeptidase/D-esterase-like protein
MALGVEGVRVGTWTSPNRVSGCTVVLPPEGTVGALAVRGAAPGTREAAALGAFGKVEVCHGVVLSGGSAFGLATADGVMRWLEERGVGYPVARARVPIVGGAIVLDAGVAEPDERPDADAGRAACDAAADDDPAEGGVGVGTGCSVAKVAGLDHAWRGGQGIAVVEAAGVRVGVLVANNAVGEVVDDDGTWIARARVGDEVGRYPLVDLPPPPTAEPATTAAADRETQAAGTAGTAEGADATGAGPTTNTVIGCIVTDASLSKLEAHRVADLAHAGISRAVRPAHTRADGDALFCLATGTATPEVAAPGDLVAHLAAEAVAIAARRGPLAATGAHGLPGLADRAG